MKTIEVVAGVIKDGDRIFATQRGYGDQKGGWEFPGGKMEPDETPEQALVRDLKEELDIEVNVGENVPSMLYGDEMRLKQVIINILTNAIKWYL